MLQRIQSYIEQFHMFADVDYIVAGVSGGADSMCLLRVLLPGRLPLWQQQRLAIK